MKNKKNKIREALREYEQRQEQRVIRKKRNNKLAREWTGPGGGVTGRRNQF